MSATTTTPFAATTAARTTTAPTAALPAARTTTPSSFALSAGETETPFRLPPFHYADPPACPPTLLALALAAAEEELCPWWAREVAPIALLGDNLGAELLCLCDGAGWARAGEAGVRVGAGVEADVRVGDAAGVTERVGGGNASLLATSRGAARPQRAREAHLPRGWQRGADWPASAEEQDDSEEEEESREGGDEETASGEGGHDRWDVLDWDEGRVSREKLGALGQWQRLGLVPCREFYLD